MTNTCLIPNGQVIIFNYPAGGGGKMLQNCVGLSRHCVLTKLEYALWQLTHVGDFDHNFYQQKLMWVLATLPTKDEMIHWVGYELGETLLYGINFLEFNKHIPVPNKEIYKLADVKLWSTVTVHNFGAVEHYINYWPTVKHVCLVNNEKFSKSNLPKKNTELNYDSDWATLGRTPSGLAFEFDVDNTIYNTNKFLDQVEKLYEYLEFDDFQPDLISAYHSKYIELHV
jgi:hypothetical protein